MTKFLACVKQHGFNLPTPNFSGKGAIFPAAIAGNKKFQAAARACASDLRAPGGTGAPGRRRRRASRARLGGRGWRP